MLETLYFYALAHQNDFDVCWPKGSVAETIFTPMVDRIKANGGEVCRAVHPAIGNGCHFSSQRLCSTPATA
jgi:hypothetical protein